jgi:hypothetical protein
MMKSEEKIIKSINQQRKREYVPPIEPDHSYTRQFNRTRMSWPMFLLMNKKYNVLFIAISLIVITLILAAAALWYFIIPWVIKGLEVLF